MTKLEKLEKAISSANVAITLMRSAERMMNKSTEDDDYTSDVLSELDLASEYLEGTLERVDTLAAELSHPKK